MNKQLLIDLGNTLAKAAIYSGTATVSHVQFSSHDLALSNWINMQNDVNQAIICAVRPIQQPLLDIFDNRKGFLVLSHETPLPFEIAYKSPETLGRDRIAAVAAAYRRFPSQNVLVIDMGTCITYDLLQADGIYLGGAISPGIHMRFKAMNSFTASLPLVQVLSPVSLIGETTTAALQSGVMNGVQAEISGIIAAYEENYKDLTVLIGGGDNKYFDKRFKNNIFAASNLVLEGLKVILDFNEDQ